MPGSVMPRPAMPTPPPPAPALATPDSMAAYYARRAASYERIYAKPERQADLRQMEAVVAEAFVGRRVLEIACGTGWWTAHGAARAAHWRATDLNPETMAIARTKPGLPACVQFQALDAYTLAGLGGSGGLDGQPFDAAFAGFWWSHVPLARLSPWLALLHSRLQPGAQVLMLDNRDVPGSSTPISRRDADGNSYQRRPLDDGSTHEVLKNYPSAVSAASALGPRAQDLRWTELPHYWLLHYRLGPA